jgi:hypothetical protein
MQPILLYYANLLLCTLVFIDLLVKFRKNPLLKLYLLLVIASIFAMNYFAITGVSTKIQFIFVKFLRLVYVCSTLLALIHLVHSKIPRWFIGLIIFSALTITGLRIAYFDQIKIDTLPNISNQIFSVGIEFYSPKPGPRYMILGLSIVAIIIAYSYYRRLLIKLNWESPHYKHLSWWVISLVAPFFLLTIFGILGNLQIFDEDLSPYLFAFFSCTTICSFVVRSRFLDPGLFRKSNQIDSHKPGSTSVA